MSQRYYSSTAQSMSLTGAASGTSLTFGLNSVSGLPVSTPFTLIVDPGKESEEVVTVTNVSGTTVTVVRGEDGTAAQPHDTGAEVRHGFSARDLREPQQHMEASSGVHGLAPGDAVAGSAALAAESAARDAEVTNRANAIAAEATARSTGDANEAAARASADALLVPKTTTVNGHALSGNVTVSLSDVGIGWGSTLPSVVTDGAIFIKLV